MKIAVIVCEYNPLHNGHLYHIAETRRQLDTDTIICIMSGSFVERGDAGILDRYIRARHAILAGAGAVLELPYAGSMLDGEHFAYHAVKLAGYIGADYLSFGSECGDIERLNAVADVLYKEPDKFKTALKENLKSGKNYPSSVAGALTQFNIEHLTFNNYANLLDTPNNMLGLMYLKALKRLNLKIIPFTVKREGSGYNDAALNKTFASASAVRGALLRIAKEQSTGNAEQLWNDIGRYVPGYVLEDLIIQNRRCPMPDVRRSLDDLILYNLRIMPESDIADLYDVTEGLEKRLKKFALQNTDYNGFLSAVKAKRYTLSRLRRIGIYALLGITKEMIKAFDAFPPYGRILAVSRKRKDILSHLSGRQNIVSSYSGLAECPSAIKLMWDFENKCDGILRLINKIPANNNDNLLLI